MEESVLYLALYGKWFLIFRYIIPVAEKGDLFGSIQIEEVLDRIMKDEAEFEKTEKRKGDVVRKVLLQWVRKKNNSPTKPQFNIPEVHLYYRKHICNACLT